MEVIKKGRELVDVEKMVNEWSSRIRCEKCDAVLRIEFKDLFRGVVGYAPGVGLGAITKPAFKCPYCKHVQLVNVPDEIKERIH